MWTSYMPAWTSSSDESLAPGHLDDLVAICLPFISFCSKWQYIYIPYTIATQKARRIRSHLFLTYKSIKHSENVDKVLLALVGSYGHGIERYMYCDLPSLKIHSHYVISHLISPLQSFTIIIYLAAMLHERNSMVQIVDSIIIYVPINILLLAWVTYQTCQSQSMQKRSAMRTSRTCIYAYILWCCVILWLPM